MSKMHEVVNAFGVFKWNTELKPRLRSGIVGERTINVQISDAEMTQIQTKNPAITSKELAEVDYLSKYDIKRVEIKADTTKTDFQSKKIAKMKVKIAEYSTSGKTDDQIKAIIRDTKAFKSGLMNETDITQAFKPDETPKKDLTEVDF